MSSDPRSRSEPPGADNVTYWPKFEYQAMEPSRASAATVTTPGQFAGNARVAFV